MCYADRPILQVALANAQCQGVLLKVCARSLSQGVLLKAALPDACGGHRPFAENLHIMQGAALFNKSIVMAKVPLPRQNGIRYGYGNL